MEMTHTQGLVNQISKDRNKKILLFETDNFNLDEFNLILETYKKFNLNCVYHRTGSGGFHFLSNTLLNLETWKKAILQLKEINKKCPMITLRVKSGKGGIYPNENYFYKSKVKINCDDPSKNVESVSLFLNKVFDFEPKLKGTLEGDLQLVSYIPKREK